MKALHIFPFFGQDLTNGSERYAYQLSRQLASQGIVVDVLATRSRQFRLTSLFAMEWQNEYSPYPERLDGLNIQRFTVTGQLPAWVGKGLSWVVANQWRREARSLQLPLYYGYTPSTLNFRRAKTRPRFYDWLVQAGLGPWSPGLLLHLARTIQQYDVVLAGCVPFALLGQVTRLARWHHKPLAILPLLHPNDPYHHHRYLYRSLHAADAILTQTAYSLNLFKQLLPGCRPIEIGAGVSPEEFEQPQISGQRFRATYGLSSNKVVLFVGRKEAGKRYDLALAAVDRLNRDDVVLVMIGEDSDRLPLRSQRVRYLGAVGRSLLLDAYAACDVFVLPSEHESFGMVFLEAWISHKPVIGNRACQPVASLIQDGVDGYLCVDAEEIANRIEQLLSDKVRSAQLAQAGYEKVLSRYTWDAVGSRTHKVYLQLASRQSV